MSPYRRNVMVGVVVLGALLTLAWMLIQFGGSMMLPFAPASVRVRFVADRADGLSNGSAVLYRGVNVGHVEKLSRAEDQLHVYIDATVDKSPPLPANLSAIIRSQGLVGSGAMLVMETTEPQPSGTLAPDQLIQTRFIGLDIIPPAFTDLALELRGAAKQFRDSGLVMHLDEQLVKTGKLVDSIQSVLSDPQVRDNLKASLESIRTSTEKADRIAANLEKFTGQLDHLTAEATATITDTHAQVLSLSKQTSDRLQQASKLLDNLDSIAEKVNKGQGTAGQIVNDPKLYQNLVETSQELSATVTELHHLIQQWEQEGVSLKVK
jgi:phospholipid/cholesterol/gamma-HCH transport system substrate-binding protein